MVDDNGGVESMSGEYKKFIQGDFGLTATYWGFGVLVAGLFYVLNWFIPDHLKWLFLIGYIAYKALLLVAVGRAAEKYEGKKVWGYLAMLSIVFGIGSDLMALKSLINY